MKIDYDGISLARESELNSSEGRLISSLIDAMKDGDIPTVSLSTVWVICDYCGGEGGHSRRFGAISAEDFAEWDEDDRHAYLSGRYDQYCEACDGSGKVRILDEDALPVEVQEWIEEYRRDAYEAAQARYYERRAGC